jgi:hypothetical protein
MTTMLRFYNKTTGKLHTQVHYARDIHIYTRARYTPAKYSTILYETNRKVFIYYEGTYL